MNVAALSSVPGGPFLSCQDFTADGSKVLSSGMDHSVKIWDIATEEVQDVVDASAHHTHSEKRYAAENGAGCCSVHIVKRMQSRTQTCTFSPSPLLPPSLSPFPSPCLSLSLFLFPSPSRSPSPLSLPPPLPPLPSSPLPLSPPLPSPSPLPLSPPPLPLHITQELPNSSSSLPSSLLTRNPHKLC